MLSAARARLAGAALALLAVSPAAADLYDDAVLEQVRTRSGPALTSMVTEDIPATIPRADRPQAAAIRVELIPRGRHPLDFFSDPGAGVVYIPLESVRFLDELAILQAWFEAKGCDASPIQTYLWALLRTGRPLPPPLAAFGIGRDRALADAYTDDVSGKLLKSAVFFILSHEVGHIMLRHQGGVSGTFSQDQERAADAFALDRFAALGTNPGGAAMFFIAARWLDPTGEAVATGSHPVAPERIAAIGQRLGTDPASFAFSEPDRARATEQVRRIGAGFDGIAAYSSDEGWLTLLPVGLERDFPLSRLERACPG